jgi:hypothetical protein
MGLEDCYVKPSPGSGGYSNSGELLGVPIITEALESKSDFTTPRSTFAQCIQQIYNDLAEAEKYFARSIILC